MLHKLRTTLPLLLVSITLASCSANKPKAVSSTKAPAKAVTVVKETPVVVEKRAPQKLIAKSQYHNPNAFTNRLSNAALNRLRSKVRYDGSYVKIAYPGGDVPSHIGVCTDVVIRSYRNLGIDLQEQVHRDMSAAFHTYPNPRKWNLSKPDTNIDHRRVYNLRNFFQRRGAALPITHNPRNYKPGDIVSWMVGPGLPHIGIVVNRRSKADPNRLMIVHNIAHGPQLEDMLFAFPITGHYRYTPAHMGNIPSESYALRKKSGGHDMSYAQLVQAANLLGTHTRSAPKTVARSNSSGITDKVVRLNSVGSAVSESKDKSILALANLSEAEIQNILIK